MFSLCVSDLNKALKILCSEFNTNSFTSSYTIRKPRGLITKEIHPCVIEFLDSTKRYITSIYRRNNIIAQLAEVVWVLGGRNDMNFLSYYLPNAVNFSDDGVVWRAGYGKRLRNWEYKNIDQFKYIIDCLKKDINSRQAVMIIWDPESEINIFNSGGSKDFPCCNWTHFMVEGGMLCMEVVIRSNDLIWGFCLPEGQKIKLLNGKTKNIENLVGKNFYVYSKDKNNNIVPGLAHSCKFTGEKNIIRFYLDNNKFFECSEEHKILLKDYKKNDKNVIFEKNLPYKMAKHINIGDSIDGLYFRENKAGYEQFTNNGIDWVNTHTMANINLKKKCRVNDINNFCVTHHKNFNKKDNRPSNLKWMYSKEHIKYHANIANSSWNEIARMKGNKNRWAIKENHEKQSLLLKNMWKNKIYRKNRKKVIEKLVNYTKNMNEKMKKDRNGKISKQVKNAWKKGKYNTEKKKISSINNLTSYNKSKLGRIRSSKNGWKCSKKNFINMWKNKKIRKKLTQLSKERLLDKKIWINMVKYKILKIYKKIEKKGLKFKEINYNKFKNRNCPKYENIFKYFNSFNELKKCAANYNHKIIKIEYVGKKKTYDFQVDKYHNFLLEEGVFVHNSHINVLEWSIIQEIFAGILQLKVGKMYYYTSSMHLYDNMFKRSELIANEDIYDIYDDYKDRQNKINFNSIEEMDNELHKFFILESTIRNGNTGLLIDINDTDIDNVFLRDVLCALSVFILKNNKQYDLAKNSLNNIACPVIKALVAEWLAREGNCIISDLGISDKALIWISDSIEYYNECHKEDK